MTESSLYVYIPVFILTFILTVLICRLIIPLLSGKAQQPIYADGPSWHISKSGTPTMGGLSFLIASLVILLLSSLFLLLNKMTYEALSLISCTVYSVFNSAIGIMDDLTKLRHHENKGLTAIEKLVLQFLGATLFLIARAILTGEIPESSIILFGFDISPLYYPLTLVILVGITNCANLTDGIDGLASSVAFAAGISIFFISYTLYTEAAFISAALVGATTAFLIFNIHPAKIFMGDTGSLFLGSALAGAAVTMGNPLIIILICGVFVIEGLSVIIQVAVYKISKKRVFRMAPLHHHLEKLGWSENKICISAILLTLILSLTAYIMTAR